MERHEPRLCADERTTLCEFLDYHRATLVMKVAGLDREALARTVLPSGLTLAGLLGHLTLVEHTWFHVRFAGGEPDEPWASAPWDDDPDWEMHAAVREDAQTLIARYERECERSRTVAASASLDDTSAVVNRETGTPWNLRWILVHMIEETARHNGHADLLREAADGTTGE
jgi:uncharacterized damage-inducible protein DinB